MTNVLEWFTAIYMIVIGLSHVAQPRLWADLFIDLLHKPYAGLWIGTLTFPLGLLIVLGHNVWVLGVPVIITVVGWGWTIKGTLYMLQPGIVQKVAKRHLAHPGRFAVAGAIFVALGAAVLAGLVPQAS